MLCQKCCVFIGTPGICATDCFMGGHIIYLATDREQPHLHEVVTLVFFHKEGAGAPPEAVPPQRLPPKILYENNRKISITIDFPLKKICGRKPIQGIFHRITIWIIYSSSSIFAIIYQTACCCSRPGEPLKPGQVTPLVLSFLLRWFNVNHRGLT